LNKAVANFTELMDLLRLASLLVMNLLYLQCMTKPLHLSQVATQTPRYPLHPSFSFPARTSQVESTCQVQWSRGLFNTARLTQLSNFQTKMPAYMSTSPSCCARALLTTISNYGSQFAQA
jgi:hypothetical protein